MNACKTCRRKDVDKINQLLVAGKPLRYFVDNYKIANGSIQRHRDNCIKALFVERREQLREGLLGKIDMLEQKFLAVEKEFGDQWQARIAAGAKQIDLLDREAKLTGAYIKDQTNEADNEAVAKKIVAQLEASGKFTPEEIAAITRERYPELTSEAVN